MGGAAPGPVTNRAGCGAVHKGSEGGGAKENGRRGCRVENAGPRDVGGDVVGGV